MTTFIDGPAKGITLQLRRAPIVLRVTQGRGQYDALDQRDDIASPDEKIYLYIQQSDTLRRFHVCRSPRSQSGWYESADYLFYRPQPPDDVLRDNEKWAAWCNGNREAILLSYHGTAWDSQPTETKADEQGD